MRNFAKLFINENIKIMKKKSTVIMLILVILSIFGAVGFAKLIGKANSYMTSYDDETIKVITQSQLDNLKVQLQKAQDNNNIDEMSHLQAQIEIYEYASKHSINMFYYNERNWKVDLLDNLVSQKATLIIMNKIPANYTVNEVNAQKTKVDTLFNIIDTDDFYKYCDVKIAELNTNFDKKEITKDEYDENIEIINLTKKYDIGKNTQNSKDNWKKEVLNDIAITNRSIRTGINFNTNKALNPEEISKLNDSLLLNEYKLENNIPPEISNMNNMNSRYIYTSMSESLSILLISILVIIMAGSAISTEVSSGTIKFLAMTPNKRWKILLAKLLSIVIIMLVITIVTALLSFLVGNMFFSSEATQPYLYVQDGQVHSIGYFSYNLLRFLSYDIDILIYMLFALMLSVVTRNTALAVGLSIAIKLGSNIIMSLINMYVKADWIKFIPFNNMELTQKMFSNSMTLNVTQNMQSMLVNVTIGFSLIVLSVCTVLMIITMFDSFNKKDIT